MERTSRRQAEPAPLPLVRPGQEGSAPATAPGLPSCDRRCSHQRCPSSTTPPGLPRRWTQESTMARMLRRLVAATSAPLVGGPASCQSAGTAGYAAAPKAHWRARGRLLTVRHVLHSSGTAPAPPPHPTPPLPRRAAGKVVGIIKRNWRTRGYCGSLQASALLYPLRHDAGPGQHCPTQTHTCRIARCCCRMSEHLLHSAPTACL